MDLSSDGIGGVFEPRFLVVEGVRVDDPQTPAFAVYDKMTESDLVGVVAWGIEASPEGALLVLKFRAPFEVDKLAAPVDGRRASSSPEVQRPIRDLPDGFARRAT